MSNFFKEVRRRRNLTALTEDATKFQVSSSASKLGNRSNDITQNAAIILILLIGDRSALSRHSSEKISPRFKNFGWLVKKSMLA